VVGCVAPGVKIVVYFAPNTDQGFVDAITKAVHDKTNNPSVLSISWGNAESVWKEQVCDIMDQAFEAAASMGVTICAAAGDTGSGDTAIGNNVDFPASNPYVLACGGTFLEARGNHIMRESVWNDDPSKSATGGGVSKLYNLPPWQSRLKITARGKLPTPLKMRGVPDVAGDADPNSGYNVSIDGNITVIGGTSAVAPLWAGLIALLNQNLGRPLGHVNPKLYSLKSGFRDITEGNNGAYEAQIGWDACTGLGTPIFPQLLAALQSPTGRGHGPALKHQDAQNA
jgi:kumamolisin